MQPISGLWEESDFLNFGIILRVDHNKDFFLKQIFLILTNVLYLE